MKISFKTDKNEIIEIDLDKLGSPVFGGQGRIYFYENYIIKVFPLDENSESIPRRFRSLKKICTRIDPNVYPFITFRGIPLATAVDVKNYFNFKTVDKAILLLFNLVKGQDLFDYLKDEFPLSEKRIDVYKKLIDILTAMNSVGIVHSDLYPDNFIVDNNQDVYVLDLEGAGIWNNQWEWMPLTTGKESLFILPPEIKFDNRFTIYSDIWTGLYLIFFVLTGFKPFDFLHRSDHKYFQNVVFSVDDSEITWPPVIPNELIIDSKRYEEFRNLYSFLFSKGEFSKVLFNTYINGYLNPDLRPSFKKIKEVINYELNLESNFYSTSQKIDLINSIPQINPTLPKTDLSNLKDSKIITQDLKDNQIITEQKSLEDQDTLFPQLPNPIADYLFKMIKDLKEYNFYTKETDIIMEKLIQSNQIDILTNIYKEKKDIYLIALFLKFTENEKWESFINNLHSLSRMLGINRYKIINQKVLPLIENYIKRKTDILQIHKDIFNQINTLLLEEINLQNKKKESSYVYFLVFVCVISFILPFVFFSIYRDYLVVIGIYPVFLIVVLIIYNLLVRRKEG